MRPRHRQAAVGQVLHQRQVEGQLALVEALEEREHIAATLGVDEVVGVLDAALAGLQRLQRPDRQAVEQVGRLRERNLGVDRHGSVQTRPVAGQKFRTFQTRLPTAPRVLPAPSESSCEPSPVMIS